MVARVGVKTVAAGSEVSMHMHMQVGKITCRSDARMYENGGGQRDVETDVDGSTTCVGMSAEKSWSDRLGIFSINEQKFVPDALWI